MRIFGLAVIAIAIACGGGAAAQQPTQAQASAIRSACRGDYQTYCASVPTGGKASLQCLQQNAASVSGGCQQALSAVSGGGGNAPVAAGGGQMSSPAPSSPPPPQMSKRQEMRVLRGACGYDFRRFCSGVALGGGRGLACLKANGPSLAPQCQSALLSMQSSR